MDRLQSMRVFQEVVDEGGFAAAARKLDLAPAVVTRLVSDLEQHLGVRLLHRTTRRQSLTPAGEIYLARLRVILAEIDEAQTAVQSNTQEMSGVLRIHAPLATARRVVAPAIARFQLLHPGVVLDLHVEDSPDPVIGDYDITVLTADTRVDADVITRPIIQSRHVLCASPSYLVRHGMPKQPQDLLEHRCLRHRTPGVRLRPLVLLDPTDSDRTIELDVPAVLMTNDRDTLLSATMDGAGISVQPLELLVPYIREGRIRRVLSPWISERVGLVAVLPSRKFMPLRTRAFLDFMVQALREAMADIGEEVAKVESEG
ncbi:LysR family transcriptional regulator [uncultured Ramlibacter sp.]|uniref:LysR family transcriptional regulator n=1 Tax=uncultured Ramlibacter sp. TaxID=260755 RepID=UPI0026189814|nr:LysR family transcriptional regulator [uncultured Ramlibacter sp.]